MLIADWNRLLGEKRLGYHGATSIWGILLNITSLQDDIEC